MHINKNNKQGWPNYAVMTITEAIGRLNALEVYLEVEMQKASEELALSMIGMIVNRIQKQGLPNRRYSINRLPEYWFYDRWLNAGGKRLYELKTRKKIRDAIRARNAFKMIPTTKYKLNSNRLIDKGQTYEEWRRSLRTGGVQYQPDDGITYKEWRTANGLQVGHVDLTFSGRMWQNLGIIGTKRIGNVWITTVGNSDPELIIRMEYNVKRFGTFLQPTEKEIALLQEQFKKRIENFINKFLSE